MNVCFNALLKGAFGGESYAHHDVMVTLDEPGLVRIFNPLDGCYTLCHSLSPAQVKRLRSAPVVRAARAKRAGKVKS